MTRVFVVGSVNVDLVMQLPHMPAIGETVLGGTFLQAGGGKGANQAAAASRLGCETMIVAAVGSDSFAVDALEDLRRHAVDVSAVVRLDGSTGVAMVVVDSDGQNIIGVASGVNSALCASDVRAALGGRLSRGDVVIGNLEVGDGALLAAAQEARLAGAWFVLNPAPARPIGGELLALCDVLTPNELEVRAIGLVDPSAALDLGVGAVVVTQGADGADLYPGSTEPGR
jgi:ribokinase